MRRAVKRLIKDGRVKIHHRWFYPDDRYVEYDGRLDGLVYMFGLYYEPVYSKDYGKGKATGYMQSDMVSMIRQEGSPVGFDPTNPDSYSENRPEIVDGSLPWLFWRIREDD